MKVIKQKKENQKYFYLSFLFILVLAFIIGINACESLPTEPTIGKRNYIWEIDTIGYAGDRIWGSSPKDIWVTAHNNWPPETIFHYDGNEWAKVGPTRRLFPVGIWGFSSSDIWFGGLDGSIWYYDGNTFEKEVELTKDGNSELAFTTMWGKNRNSLFAFGAYPDQNLDLNNPVIARRNNGKWELLNTDGIIGIVSALYLNNQSELYIRNIKWGHAYIDIDDQDKNSYDSTQIYQYKNGKFEKLYTSQWLYGYTANIGLVGDEVLFCLGNKISRRNNNEFHTVFEITNYDFYGNIWGRSTNDIFLEMTDGIAHYNGNDIEYLQHFSLPRTRVYDAVLFEKDVFFLVSEGYNNLVYHGRLE